MPNDTILFQGNHILMKKGKKMQGEVKVPGDKSISHRAIMLGALAEGRTEIHNFLSGADCLSTLHIFRHLGVSAEQEENRVTIKGVGLHGLRAPKEDLYAGNSGTTVRLLSGILAAQNFTSIVDGDASIRKRPMKRIIDPLTQMGASITSLPENGCAPLLIEGCRLQGIDYHSPVSSAQVKSSVLLAGLYTDDLVRVTEPETSRDHTERMLRYFGTEVKTSGTTVCLTGNRTLSGQLVEIPGDISSAAYFMAAAAILPNSEILIKNIGINPTRDGILKVMKDMGASITLLRERMVSGEPVADILIRSSSLHGTSISGSIIPTLIDELPILAVVAAYAEGTTVIRDAAELKVKESNRIDAMVKNLTLMGADAEATSDGMIIHGGKPLHGATLTVQADHRIAMSFAVAALQAEGETKLLDGKCVAISYPDFYETLAKVIV